jgi:hypothetical protein
VAAGKPAAAVEIAVVIGGREHFLVPTLRAAIAVSRRYGGFAAAFQKIAALDLDAAVQIAAAGLDKRDPDELKAIEREIFAHGVALLVEPLSRFVECLANGGREPGKEPEERDDDPSKKP